MNARIIELLKNRHLLQSSDLPILAAELQVRPYQQSLHALHLLATKQFDEKNFDRILSRTAAYTTDKKILYHLIKGQNPESALETQNSFATDRPVTANAEIEANAEVSLGTAASGEGSPEPSIKNKTTANTETPEKLEEPAPDAKSGLQTDYEKESIADSEQEIEPAKAKIPDENISDPKIESSDSESISAEKNKLEETGKIDSNEIAGTPEAVVEQDKPKTAEEVAEGSELSFHGMEEFLPEVKITPPASKPEAETPVLSSKPAVNRHEEEMRRLIEEVEAKMKQKKAAESADKKKEERGREKAAAEKPSLENSVKKEPDTEIRNENNLQKVPVELVGEKVENPKTEKQDKSAAFTEKSTESNNSSENSERSWQPMTPPVMTPDALLNKPVEKETIVATPHSEPDVSAKEVETSETVLENILPENTDAPHNSKPAETITPAEESNVPVFINTWQNWLKIDRTSQPQEITSKHTADNPVEPVIQETADQVTIAGPKTDEEVSTPHEDPKNQAIKRFIEAEPRISPLRDDTLVYKERNGDISHLMTETLANIYVEQKLYARAIRGFEVLISKHPEKTEHYRQRIQQIKELRSANNFTSGN